MSQINEVDQAVKKPAAKRSWIERSLVWGLILVLLVIVGIEWTSRRGYEDTLDRLDTAIQQLLPKRNDRGIFAADIERHVRGYTFRGHLSHGKKKYETFQWPSLFRFYKLIVLIDAQGIARTVDAYSVNPETQ